MRQECRAAIVSQLSPALGCIAHSPGARSSSPRLPAAAGLQPVTFPAPGAAGELDSCRDFLGNVGRWVVDRGWDCIVCASPSLPPSDCAVCLLLQPVLVLPSSQGRSCWGACAQLPGFGSALKWRICLKLISAGQFQTAPQGCNKSRWEITSPSTPPSIHPPTHPPSLPPSPLLSSPETGDHL